MGNPTSPIKARNGKNGKDRKRSGFFSGTKDSDAHRDLSERYASAVTHGVIYTGLTIENHAPGGNGSIRLNSLDIDVICAAGMARHWGTSLIRLKYGNDASEYRSVLRQWQSIAVDTANRLNWEDEELARFMAEFVLLAWLLDRDFQGKGEWKRQCIILRNKLNREALEAASIIALKLG